MSKYYNLGQAAGILLGLVGGTIIADRLFTPKTKNAFTRNYE